MVYHSACPEWLQKATVTSVGPRDQQIRLEWPATCIFCKPNLETNRARLLVQSVLNDHTQERSLARCTSPTGGEVVSSSSNAPQQNRYQSSSVAAILGPFPKENKLLKQTVNDQG